MNNLLKCFYSLAVISIIFISGSVNSEDIKAPALKISPLKYEEKLKLGDVKDGFIDIQNPTTKDLNLAVEISSLRANKKSNNIEFYQDDSRKNFETFVKLEEKQFVLPANTGRKYKFRLGIPVDSKSGGYYGAIFFRIMPEKNGQDTSATLVSGRVGTLFILEVGDGGLRTGELTNFRSQGGIFDYSENFLIQAVNNGTYGTDNRGLPLKPVGTLEVKNIFGKKVFEKKIENVYVLPETEKTIKTEYKSPLVLGVYTAKLSLAKYPGEPVEVREITFVKISPTVIFITIFIFLSLFVLFSFLKSHSKARPKKRHSQ